MPWYQDGVIICCIRPGGRANQLTQVIVASLYVELARAEIVILHERTFSPLETSCDFSLLSQRAFREKNTRDQAYIANSLESKRHTN